MAHYRRLRVAQTILDTGLVPVFYHSDITIAKQVLKACYDGGVRIFEFTNRGDLAHEVFRDLNVYALNELPGMILGVGSVVDAGTTSLYLQLGANFIVSPVLNPEMARVCNRRKVLWSPGCGSLSEISQAEELGAEIVKIFPATEVGGPGFVKSVLGPNPWTFIMPTGGVKPEEPNVKEWFEAGVACVGMGSQLFPADWIRDGKFADITKKVAEAMAMVRTYSKHIQ